MDIATPGELLPVIKSVSTALGKVMSVMLSEDKTPGAVSTNNTNDTMDSNMGTTEDPCLALPPIDMINANKPGVVEYETDIGDSGIINVLKNII